MRIFIASAKLDDIRWAHSHGLVDGVLTTPSLLTAQVHPAGANDLLADICRVATFPVAVTVGAVNANDIYRDAREIAKLSDTVIVQIPFVEDAIGAMKRLRSEGVRVAATLVFNAAQAILAAKAGASYISPFVGRLDDVATNGMELVREIVEIYDNYEFTTEVLVASCRHPIHIVEAARIGADICTCPPAVIDQLFNHPLTNIGLEKFLKDWEKSQAVKA